MLRFLSICSLFVCVHFAYAADVTPLTTVGDPTNYDPECSNSLNAGNAPKSDDKSPGPEPDSETSSTGEEEEEKTCEPCTTGEGTIEGDPGNELETKCASIIDLISKEHRHNAVDYQLEYMPVPLGGCSPCGSSESLSPKEGRLRNLSVKRYRRSLGYYNIGSFGRGGVSEFDDKITVFREDSHQGDGVGYCQLFLANDTGDSHFFMEHDSFYHNDTSVDGIYRDRKGYYESLTLKDVNGVITADQQLAVTAELLYYDGRIKVFELFTGFGDTLQGRVTKILSRNNNEMTVTYQHAVGTLTGNDRTKYSMIDKVTDVYGNEASFTYQAYSIRWVVNQIDLPGNVSLSYTYDSMGNLTSVTYPDGSVSNFTYAYDSALQLDTVEFDDAGATDTHRRKKAYFSALSYTLPDQTTINVTPGHTRKIQTLAGETLFAMYASTYDNENFIYEGGNKFARYEFDLDQNIKRIDYATNYVHDENLAVPDVSTLQWEFAKSIDGNPYKRLYTGFTTAELIETTQTFDLSNRSISGRSYADGSQRSVVLNDFNLKTENVDRLGREVDWVYDVNGNLLSATYAPGTTEEGVYSWTYNTRGQVLTKTDANGNVTNYEYGSDLRLAKIIEPADFPGDPRAEQNFTYDSLGRLISLTDPEGRTTQFTYDLRNRVTQVTYNDNSTQQYVYGTGQDKNLLVSQLDRNGNTTKYTYDSYGRKTLTEFAFGTPEQIEELCTYLPGTDMKATCTKAGELTTYTHDYQNRVIASARQASITTTLTSHREYDNRGKLVSTTDAYGRSKFFVYDVNGRKVREVQEAVPNALTLSSADDAPTNGFAQTGVAGQPYIRSLRDEDLVALTRDGNPNAKYIIKDWEYDSEGQLLKYIDPRGIEDTYQYDQRGRKIEFIVAAGTAVAATTQWDYDAQNNIIEIRSPRYFDVNDLEGYQQANTTFTYTGRNLLASETKAAASAIAATRSFTYFLDSRVKNTIDFRGNIWAKLWHICCGRLQASIDPTNSGTISNTDFNGNITHTAVAANLPLDVALYDWHNPIDADTVNETTMRYDALNRVTHQTTWLVPLATVVDHARVNLGNGVVPIAGEDGVPATDGLTTRYVYDDDLTDGIGLDVTYASYLTSLDLGAGSDGKAVEMTNPENEKSVTIYDGLGRRVLFIDGNGNADTITYDAVVTIAGYGDVLETSQSDALVHIIKQRSDGLGRTVEKEDAENNISIMTYDANRNRISHRDPNNVGLDCVFDERDREISCTDTQGDATTQAYDLANNKTVETDALGNATTCIFDARGRKISCTDRINAVTSFAYDANNNLLTITDAEGGITSYIYDVRNLLDQETFPQGDAGTTRKTYTYDAARRLVERIVDTVETPATFDETDYVYDMADRLLERQYPQETNADDVFTYDAASRMLSATSNRYDNVITRTYDAASRLTAETLAIDSTVYTVGYGYDIADRQTSITYPNGKVVTRAYTDRNQLSGLTYDGSNVSTFAYDVGMRETSRSYQNGITTTTTYRADNLVSTINAPGVIGFTYSYDANKRKTQELDTINLTSSQNFSYDNEDRLTGWNTDLAATVQSWNLSLVGDWDSTVRTGTDPINETRTHTDVHEVTAINSNTLSYDYRGNLINDGTKDQQYTWDTENRLKNADINAGTITTAYEYDALNRRVQKEIIESGLVETITFISSGSRIISEYKNGIERQSYIYASFVDEPIGVIELDGDCYYYHRNHLYSIEAITDSLAVVAELYDYDAYGKLITVLNDTNLDQPYGFTGRRFESETGLWYFRARYFEPNQGRFISRDLLGYIDGFSMYNPYYIPNGVDPMGLWSGGDPWNDGGLWLWPDDETDECEAENEVPKNEGEFDEPELPEYPELEEGFPEDEEPGMDDDDYFDDDMDDHLPVDDGDGDPYDGIDPDDIDWPARPGFDSDGREEPPIWKDPNSGHELYDDGTWSIPIQDDASGDWNAPTLPPSGNS